MQEIHLWLGNWWHIQLLLPESNFNWTVCVIPNLDHVKWLVNFTLSVNKYHDICSSGTVHHKFDWDLCHVNNQTQGWGALDKYMICCFKSTAVMFFSANKMYFKLLDDLLGCVLVTLVRNRYQPDFLSQCQFDVGPAKCYLDEHNISHVCGFKNCLSRTGITNYKWVVGPRESWDWQTVFKVDREWFYRYLNLSGARPTIFLGLVWNVQGWWITVI